MRLKEYLAYAVLKAEYTGTPFRDYLVSQVIDHGDENNSGTVQSVASNGVAVTYSSDGVDSSTFISYANELIDRYDEISTDNPSYTECQIISQLKDEYKTSANNIRTDFSSLQR